MSPAARPFGDLRLGLRLALGARRGAWLRLALTALGTGIGVVVLLVAASVPHAVNRNHDRSVAVEVSSEPIAGVHPLRMLDSSTEYHGDSIRLEYLKGPGPVPPGLSRLPGPGELVVSPALAHLLTSSGGALLRPRFPGQVIGTIGKDGLTGPASMIAYIGASGSMEGSEPVYSFGEPGPPGQPIPVLLWVLLVVGVVVLLFPVFVFVVTASRLSGAERDRRLAAIRLIGADGRQIRRIAAGESILGSVAGLVLGGALFLALRPLVEHQTISGVSVFASDVQPSTPLIVLIVVAIPVLAVGATLFALRHTVIEPLGVVRQGAPARRRLWWRLTLVGLGIALLLKEADNGSGRPSTTGLVAGIVLLLLGIPVLLPWLLQMVVGKASRGAPAMQLATGRLRLDSGTPARVVAGVAVVLAGSVALFTLVAAAQRSYGITTDSGDNGKGSFYLEGVTRQQAESVAAKARAVPGVQAAGVTRQVDLVDKDQSYYSGAVASCRDITALYHVRCRNGDAFASYDGDQLAGRTLRLPAHKSRHIRLPAHFQSIAGDTGGAALILTPAALPAGVVTGSQWNLPVHFDWHDSDVVEGVRNAAAPLQWRAQFNDDTSVSLNTDQKTFSTIKRGLYAGALLTLGMAAATMLVLAIEQVAERRRPLAVLAASGVPRSMLARSVLLQNAIPLALAVVIADITGLVLGAFLLKVAHQPARLDLTDLGVLTGLAILAVAAATLLTLPAVRRATRPTMLRAE